MSRFNLLMCRFDTHFLFADSKAVLASPVTSQQFIAKSQQAQAQSKGAATSQQHLSCQQSTTQFDPLTEARRKSKQKKDFIMAELINTELAYKSDLEVCVTKYLFQYRSDCERIREQISSPPASSGLSPPSIILDKEKILFGNIEEIYKFHNETFLKELQKYQTIPEDVGHCFVTWAKSFDIYVTYCKNKSDSTALLILPDVTAYFDKIQRTNNILHPIQSYLIMPVQRITRYQLLLKELLLNCDEGLQDEIRDGLDVMLSVPKKANDAVALSELEGCDVLPETLGDVILQDGFTIEFSKSLLPTRKKERRVFLFDHYLVFAKEVKVHESSNSSANVTTATIGGNKDPTGTSSSGHHGSSASLVPSVLPGNTQKVKLVYKNKLLTSEIGITEHVDSDECKFAIWTNAAAVAAAKSAAIASTVNGGSGSGPGFGGSNVYASAVKSAGVTQENKIILKAADLETKLLWVKKMREVIQGSFFNSSLSTLALTPISTSVATGAGVTVRTNQLSSTNSTAATPNGTLAGQQHQQSLVSSSSVVVGSCLLPLALAEGSSVVVKRKDSTKSSDSSSSDLLALAGNSTLLPDGPCDVSARTFFPLPPPPRHPHPHPRSWAFE